MDLLLIKSDISGTIVRYLSFDDIHEIELQMSFHRIIYHPLKTYLLSPASKAPIFRIFKRDLFENPFGGAFKTLSNGQQMIEYLSNHSNCIVF